MSKLESGQSMVAGAGTGSRGNGALSRFLALEPRVLLDAAALETAEAVAAQADDGSAPPDSLANDVVTAFAGGNVVVSPLASGAGAREILFVDAGIANYQALTSNLGPDVEVHILQGADWAAQIQSVLGRRDGDVRAIHLVSHGSAGQLLIGGDTVSLSGLDEHARVWSSMQQALAPDGDLLLYGCDVGAGETGATFLRALSERTGADVGASEDLTGVATLGGDWDLEHSVGSVEASSLYAAGAAEDFMSVLADGFVQDTEITSGTSSVAITRTTDGKDWKFVANSGSNKVDVYLRNNVTGAWGNAAGTAGTPFVTLTKSGQFGFDIAAAGNKLVVGAPTYDPSTSNAEDGYVFVYTWNTTSWVEQVVEFQRASGSGRTGYNSGPSDAAATRGTAEQFGYSVDIAYDGNGNYRLIVGNPFEDWWQYDDDSNDDSWGGSETERYVRQDAGAAFVFSASSHGNFDEVTFTQIVSQVDNTTTGNGHLFGAVVAAGYDQDSANWWYAVGGDGLDAVRMYDAPGTGVIGATGHSQAFTWDSSGVNDVSMHDDYLLIANAGGIQAYKVDATSTTWNTAGGVFGGANAVVYVHDRNQLAAGDSVHDVRVFFSDASGTWLADLNADTGGQFDVWAQVSTRVETSVAIDRYWSLDLVMSNGTDARSYHYNWDPLTQDDVLGAVNEGGSVVITGSSILANDTDFNITGYPSPTAGRSVFGDQLAIGAVGTSSIGATVSLSGGNITYNTATSSFIDSLAAGQVYVDTVTVTVSDGQGGSSTQSLKVTITGVNDAPVTTGLVPLVPYGYQQSGSTNAYDFSAYFTDVDSGEASALVPIATALPSAAWSAVADGNLLRVTAPANATAGNYSITVQVRDPQGALSGTRTFVIAIDDTNQAPFVRSPVVDQVALAGYNYSFVLPANTFGDPDPAPFDNITYSATLSSGAALPAWLSFDPVYRTFSGEPTSANVGSITVRVTANDNASATRGGPATVYTDFVITIVNPAVKTLSPFTDGPAANANFGFSTAISEDGNWLVVGAPQHNGYGTIWMYQWNGSGWTYVNGLTPTTAAGSQTGWSVDISNDGTTIAVGARSNNGGRGAVYLYTRSGTTFTLSRTWTAASAYADDRFGASVALNESGSHILIGASHYDAGGLTDSGAAFMYTTATASGALTANILPKDPAAFDLFGSSVAFDQNILVVAAPRDDNAQGMVSRLEFNGSGNYEAPDFGTVGGTLSASAQFYFDGSRGEVVYLTGTDGRVALDSAVDLEASWTIASWFKGISSTAGLRVLASGGSYHQVVIDSTGLLGLATDVASPVFTSSGWNISSLANPTAWHHIAAVAEGTTVTFYVDGVKVGNSVSVKPTDEVTTIGGDTVNGRRFADYIDDFRIYSRALSQSEIRNLVAGAASTDAAYSDLGSLYVFSTDLGSQVAKLYAPDGRTGDMLGWAIDVDIYDLGGTARQGGLIVASSIYNDQAATDGGAVYVWRSVSQQSGAQNNGGLGNGTWKLETKLTSFDTTAGDYFGSDVAVDYDESTGGTRLLVGAQFEDTAGAYAGAVYAYKFNTYSDVRDTAGSWVPEKFASASPQFGSTAVSEFFGSSVAIADTRAVIGARWRDTGGQANDGAVYWANLQTQGNYSTVLSAETVAGHSFFLPAEELAVVALDTSNLQGQVSFDAQGRMQYTAGSAFKSLGLGQTATDTFVYLTEQGGVTYTNTVTVTVHGVDDGVEASNDVIQVSASSATLLNVLANDADPDGDGVLSIQSLVATGLSGRLYSTGGAVVYDPRGRFDSLVAGETAQETFAYTVTNAEGQTSTAYVTLLITGEDDPVVAVNDAATVKANSVVTVDVLANDLDKDGQDTFAVVSLDTSAAQGSAIINADGTISYLPGSAFSYLKAGETATDTIVYTVRDASGNESTALLVITVLGVNDAPVAVNDAVTVAGGQTVAVDVLANDTDPDAGELRVTRVISDGTLGTAVLNADGTISYTASAGAVADRFSYEVIDSLGKTSIATVFVNHEGGVPGGQGTVDDVAVTRGMEPVRVAVVANDAPGAVVVGLQVDGATGQVVLGEDGALVYTPAESMARLPAGVVFVDTFTYRAQLADGSVDTATVRIYVNGIWVAPAMEEEERFALLPALQDGGPVLLATMEVTAPADAPAVDTVARMALDALVELAAAVPAEDIDVAPAQEAAPQPEAMPADAGKPALSAALHREALAKRAGVDALLKHFSGHAA